MIRKISAHYIFPADAPPIKRGIIVTNEHGEILDLIDTGGVLPEISNLEFYDGIITPGFINTHINPELSNLKGQIIVLCPNSNLQIEGHLPDINLLRNEGHRIAIGTKSLYPDATFSILEELKTIQQHFPQISLRELVDWGTINGAIALGCDDLFGSLKIGKKPGLNLITDIDFQQMKFTLQSEVKVF